MKLGPDGRLEREGLPLEMSAYDRRAVAKGVELARDDRRYVHRGHARARRRPTTYFARRSRSARPMACTSPMSRSRAPTRWPPRERLPPRCGSSEPFDLILVGRNSVDADTGQVGPELAQLLDLPFATGVKQLVVRDGVAEVGLELDDEWVDASVTLPAVLSTAERLIDPCKIKDPEVWATVDPARIRRLAASDLGPGPWGQAGSPTRVGETRAEIVERTCLIAFRHRGRAGRPGRRVPEGPGALLPGVTEEVEDEVAPVSGADLAVAGQ